MKKCILLAILLNLSVMGFSQSQRLVFVEEFTQASCPPCESTTPALNAIVEANKEKIVQIRYQTSWPGVDPMNADNPSEVQTRVNYYGVTGVPNVFADGVDTEVVGGLPQSIIDTRYATDAPFLIEVSHTFNDLSTMDVTVHITNEGTETFDDPGDKLRVALVEEVISWPSPPGSTSLVDFEAVMKTFFTGTAGIVLDSIQGGETWEMTWEGLEIPDYIYNYNELAVVAWVQNDATKAVHNSGYSAPQLIEGYADLGLTNAISNTSDDLCDLAFSGEVTIENTGAGDLGSYEVELYINDVVIETQTKSEGLVAGGTEVVTFDGYTLNPGSSVIRYGVNTEDVDVSSLNNLSGSIVTGKAGIPQDLVEEGFEEDLENTYGANTIVDMPNLGTIALNGGISSSANTIAESPIGGYGQSEKTIFVNLWQWDPASIGTSTGEIVVANQYLVPEDGGLEFDYAYTSWSGSNDVLKVLISEDCGETYTELWSKSGSALATAPQINANDTYFTPSASQWKTVTIDLADYSGSEVLVKLEVVSAWGDMLYIDNIVLNSIEVVINTEDLSVNEKIDVYPNPVSDFLTVDLSVENPTDVSVELFDMTGRKIQSNFIANGISNSTFTVDVSNLKSGMYMLNFNLGERNVIREISVVK